MMTKKAAMTIDEAREIERAYLAGDDDARCFEPWAKAMAGYPADEIMEAAMDDADAVLDALDAHEREYEGACDAQAARKLDD
jgi:hypothetical protein